MKKKILVVFALLTVALLVLSACDIGANDLQKYNDMLKISYSEVQVLINTKSTTAQLDGTFTLTFDGDETTVKYDFDKYNTFEIGSDGSIVAPDGGFVVSQSGTIVVRNGEIVEGDDSVELPEELGIYAGGFSFKQAFFANSSVNNAKFEADVTNPQGFTGNDSLVCSDMHVALIQNVSARAISNIVLTYVAANGAEVTINYLFTK